jgi:hypothetical protein
MKKIIGSALFIIGLISLISSQTGITGNTISEVVGSLGSSLGLIMVIGGLVLMVYKNEPQKLYHGTCKAFVELAKERGENFGPDDEIYLTPDLEHAKMFAESWNTDRGRKRLGEYFKELPKEYAESVILEFDQDKLGDLEKSLDAGGAIQFSKKGPLKLDKK